jgi:hypothetical protein
MKMFEMVSSTRVGAIWLGMMGFQGMREGRNASWEVKIR